MKQMKLVYLVRVLSVGIVGRHARYVIDPRDQLAIRLQNTRHLAQPERQIEEMIEGRRNDESVKAFIRPGNSLGDRSDKKKGMRLRGTERINSRDARQIITLKINRHRDRPTADVEHRP